MQERGKEKNGHQVTWLSKWRGHEVFYHSFEENTIT